MTLQTRKPTGKPPWPFLLLAGVQKSGKSWAASMMSASDLIDRTFWIEVGEGAADQYGALPGARYEIVEHDGSLRAILGAIHDIKQLPTDGKPHAIVIDSMTELWDLLVDEQQRKANEKRNRQEAQITLDQWNVAKKRWKNIIDALRTHNGPVVVTARLDEVMVMGDDGKPSTAREWKVKAEKNLPYEVDGIVEMPKPGVAILTGVRSVTVHTPPNGLPLDDFSIDSLWRQLGLDADGATAPRNYSAPDSSKASTTDEPWLIATRELIEAEQSKEDMQAVWERMSEGVANGLVSQVDYDALEVMWHAAADKYRNQPAEKDAA
ncbi:MAG: AAA family ATPase [Candidatus Nanopelagicales bacterium]